MTPTMATAPPRAARPPAGPPATRATLALDPATRARSVTFGRVVRAYRLHAGLSQEQLAQKAGCDRQSVNRVENATYSPSLPRIFRLADALDRDVTDLFICEVPNLAPARAYIR